MHKQRLPNECLALIIRTFATDIKSLHSFLFVNQFFFYTAVPLLMHDAFITWELNRWDGRNRKDKEKLMALVVASVVHHNQRSTSEAFDPQDILDKFGLELTWPASMDLVSRCLEADAKMTTDYSKHFTFLEAFLWDQTDYDGFLHLKEDNNYVSTTLDAGVHPVSTTLRLAPPVHITERIANLLLYYNYEHVVHISLHIKDTAQYLPLADKLVRLRTIELAREREELRREDLTAFLDFLRIHHAAFPHKRRLLIDFNCNWTMRHINTPESRQLAREHQQGMVDICKTLGRIYTLEARDLVDFYTLWEDIDLGYLEEMVERDEDRWSHDEKQEDQVVFFKRCNNLRSLELITKIPSTFSWAVDQGTKARQYLPKLRHIDLDYVGFPRDAVRILSDAIASFASSLRTVVVECGVFDRRVEAPDIFPGEILDNWNLPWLTDLKIEIPKLHGLRIGSLDLCPMLKSLILRFGVGKPRQELDANDAVELFPKWTLPRLTELKLDCTPALLFNLDSLETMSSLREIRFYAHEDSEFSRYIDRIPHLSAHVTPLRDPESGLVPEPQVDNEGMAFSSGQGRWLGGWRLPLLETLTLQGPCSFVFCFDWLKGCPRLNYLDLYCSDLPQRLPLSWAVPCASALVPKTEATEIPWVDGYDPTPPQMYQPLGPFSGNAEDPMLLDSQLETLRLYGNWVMSEQDFVRVLTHYAPNLKDLDTETIHEESDSYQKAHQFVHFFLEADRIRHELIGLGAPNKEVGEQEPIPDHMDYPPRRTKLTMVKAKYSIHDSTVDDLGMVLISGGELVEKYTSAGLRVYKFCSWYFVNTVNHEFIEGGPDEEDEDTNP